MRVGLDFRPAVRKNSRRRGVGKYTRRLVQALIEESRTEEFILYTCAGEETGLNGQYEWRELFQLRRPLRANWMVDRLLLPRAIRRDRLDIFHGTDIIWPDPCSDLKVCATVHDMIPFIFWDQSRQSTPVDYRLGLWSFFKRIPFLDAVFTDSECSRRDICKRTGAASEAVHVVYPGPVHECRPIEAERARHELRRNTGFSHPFLFYVGGTDFRKNLGFLLEVYAAICKAGYGGKLLLGGETFLWKIPEADSVRRKIAELDLEPRVLLVGHIPEEMLPLYYSACDAFLFPSLYEGFGLPVLEAMQAGAPIVAARTSSIPEVAGDSAFYFEAQELESAVSACETALNDSQAVAEKRNIGLQRARRFTWEKAARRILAVYDELSGK